MARRWLCGDFSCPLCYQQPGGARKDYQQQGGMTLGRSFVPPLLADPSYRPGRSFVPPLPRAVAQSFVPPPPRAVEARPLNAQTQKNKKCQPSGGREEAVVLSYFHTVSAAVQILKISEESVKMLGESSSDLKTKITSQYGSDKWRQVQVKSLVDEKSRKVEERQKELQKQQAKVNRITEKLLESKYGGANKPKSKAAPNEKLVESTNESHPKPKAAGTKKLEASNRPQPKPKTTSNLPKAMAANPFLSLFEDSDDDEDDKQ